MLLARPPLGLPVVVQDELGGLERAIAASTGDDDALRAEADDVRYSVAGGFDHEPGMFVDRAPPLVDPEVIGDVQRFGEYPFLVLQGYGTHTASQHASATEQRQEARSDVAGTT